ncbi:MAG: hypothetical protein DMG86_22525 [Acidobacteria bacterium]|nr:MAG: hypothetical protein DMG86_22525 [Acidobacteriota bacterium]PYX11874.1 MAG: hypothetical protein DMG84_22980 [Acidobacteriota bacterium]
MVRVGLIIVLVIAMSAALFGQIGISGIGSSGAQVAGAVAGLVAVTGAVLYFTVHKPSIVGCAQSSNATNTRVSHKLFSKLN